MNMMNHSDRKYLAGHRGPCRRGQGRGVKFEPRGPAGDGELKGGLRSAFYFCPLVEIFGYNTIILYFARGGRSDP
jgi:hypothetical protein